MKHFLIMQILFFITTLSANLKIDDKEFLEYIAKLDKKIDYLNQRVIKQNENNQLIHSRLKDENELSKESGSILTTQTVDDILYTDLKNSSGFFEDKANKEKLMKITVHYSKYIEGIQINNNELKGYLSDNEVVFRLNENERINKIFIKRDEKINCIKFYTDKERESSFFGNCSFGVDKTILFAPHSLIGFYGDISKINRLITIGFILKEASIKEIVFKKLDYLSTIVSKNDSFIASLPDKLNASQINLYSINQNLKELSTNVNDKFFPIKKKDIEFVKFTIDAFFTSNSGKNIEVLKNKNLMEGICVTRPSHSIQGVSITIELDGEYEFDTIDYALLTCDNCRINSFELDTSKDGVNFIRNNKIINTTRNTTVNTIKMIKLEKSSAKYIRLSNNNGCNYTDYLGISYLFIYKLGDIS